MKYSEFEDVMSATRMARYLAASPNDTRKAMTLYRRNLSLCQELFTVISCFEIALRNRIDRHYSTIHGDDWIRDSIQTGGIFDRKTTWRTKKVIQTCLQRLTSYTPPKLLAELDFGFWRYLFAQPQFYAGGQSLLQVFPAKPRSSPAIQYNHTFVFNDLGKINDLRNRIAHHEPICFAVGQAMKDTTYARQHYNLILQFFQWMSVDEAALLYGLDHIVTECNEIDSL